MYRMPVHGTASVRKIGEQRKLCGCACHTLDGAWLDSKAPTLWAWTGTSCAAMSRPGFINDGICVAAAVESPRAQARRLRALLEVLGFEGRGAQTRFAEVARIPRFEKSRVATNKSMIGVSIFTGMISSPAFALAL
jgi:hypothetical protein